MFEWYLLEQIPRVPQPLRIRKIIGVPLILFSLGKIDIRCENYQEYLISKYFR